MKKLREMLRSARDRERFPARAQLNGHHARHAQVIDNVLWLLYQHAAGGEGRPTRFYP